MKTSHTPYTQVHEFKSLIRGQALTFITKPGIPNWDQITPAGILLAENVRFSGGSRGLLLGCGHGALGVILARQNPHGRLWLMDTNHIALKMAELTLQANQVITARIHPEISVLPAGSQTFDTVIIDLPKGRKLAQRWLVEAYAALRENGELYLAGANGDGIQSVIKDATALFGNVSILAYKKGNRIARLRKSIPGPIAPSWSQLPGIAPGTWLEFEIKTPVGILPLRSLPGVFSSDRLDEGTRLLLDVLTISPAARVLDLGCGYGLLGLHAAKVGAAQVDLVDINLLAVAAARENLKLHAIRNAQAFPSDILAAVPDSRYTCVVTNPPFHTGQAVDYQVTQAFIEQTQAVLAPDGQFWIVANRFIPYDQILKDLFTRVDRKAESARYQVWLAVR